MSIAGNNRFIAVAFDSTLELWNPSRNIRHVHGFKSTLQIKKLECTNDGGVALTKNGKVIFFNHDRHVYPEDEEFIDISSGENDVVLVTKRGEFIKIGKSKKLNCLTTAPPPVAVSIGAAKIAYTSMGKLYVDGKEVQTETAVQQAAVGGGHTIFLDCNNQLWGFGSNQKGQLGIPDIQYVNEPVKIPFEGVVKKFVVGHEHTLILDSEGQLWGCGSNAANQLGERLSDAPLTKLTKINLEDSEEIIDIYARCNLSFLLKKNGDLEQFGNRA